MSDQSASKIEVFKKCQQYKRTPNVRWSTKKCLRWKGAIYHSIKLPFDVEVAEKFLNGILSPVGEFCLFSKDKKKNHCLAICHVAKNIITGKFSKL